MQIRHNQGANAGVFEFIFGHQTNQREKILKYWEVLGFTPCNEGTLSSADAHNLYDHDSDLTSIRLSHCGCEMAQGGYVRLQFWERLRNEGLGTCKPLDVGSLWMGLYTKDILSVRDAHADQISTHGDSGTVSPIVRAPLEWPEPKFGYHERFVGLRELVVLAPNYRQAFIQRAGFDRPGFGTFDSNTPFQNTEGTHANIVQPTGGFDSEFYKTVFHLETAPYGEAEDAGDKPSTIAVFELSDGQMFKIERLKHPKSPSGMLQVYSPHYESPDKRDLARPGSRGLCCYSFSTDTISALMSTAVVSGAESPSQVLEDEFGNPASSFNAPDGIRWVVTGNGV